MLDARIGGSPLNVAIGLARLQQPVAFFGALSSGFPGDRLLKALHDEAIDTQCIVRLQAPSTLSLVGLDAQGVPSYAIYGEGAADRQLPLSALAAVPPAQAYQFGSYAMVVEPVAGTQRDTLQWMLPRTHILKISDEDLGLLCPGTATSDLAQQWLAAGVSLVVVTRDGQGAWGWTATHHIATEPVSVAVVDTVSAGDSFQATLLTALAERGLLSPTALQGLGAASLHELLQLAVRCAAITCSRRGADLPRRAELNQFSVGRHLAPGLIFHSDRAVSIAATRSRPRCKAIAGFTPGWAMSAR